MGQDTMYRCKHGTTVAVRMGTGTWVGSPCRWCHFENLGKRWHLSLSGSTGARQVR